MSSDAPPSPRAWRSNDPRACLGLTAQLGAILALVLVLEAVLNPREAYDGRLLVAAAGASAGLAAIAWGRLLGTPDDRIDAIVVLTIDLLSLAGASLFVLLLGGLPPAILFYALLIVQTTFGYPLRTRLVLNALTVTVAVAVQLVVGAGIDNAILSAGFYLAVALVAEARVRDTEEQAEAELQAHLQSARRAMTVRQAADLRGLEPQQIHDRLASALGTLELARAAVVMIDGDERHVVAVSGRVLEGPERVAVGQGLGGRAIREDRTIVVQDYDAEPDAIPGAMTGKSAAFVPLRRFGVPVGVVNVSRSRDFPLGPDDVDAVEALALHASTALENAAVYARERAVLERLQEVDRLGDDLLANVSYELRAPLHAILGHSETLATRGGQLSDEQTVALVDGVVDNAARLRERIETTLAHARFQSGHRQVEFGPVDLGAMIEEVGRRLGPWVQDGLTCRVPEDRAVVRVDRRLIEHVLDRLVLQLAQDSSSAVLVTVDHRHDRVEIRLQAGRELAAGEQSLPVPPELSLAAAVVEAHGSDLQLAGTDRVTTAWFELVLETELAGATT